MFLLQPFVFFWDLEILTLLAGCSALAVAGWRAGQKRGKEKSIVSIGIGLMTALAVLGFVLIFYGSFIEPKILVTTQYTLAKSTLPPLKIAVVSDLHVGPYKGETWVEKVARQTNATQPDLILLPGDFLFTPAAHVEDLEPLKNLHAALGVYAVLGNHDEGKLTVNGKHYTAGSDAMAAYLRTLGINVLRNDAVTMTLPEGEVAIAGVDDPLFQNYQVADALKSVPENVPLILLSHSPDVIQNPDSRRAVLVVAGHTHGGQIRLPFWGPLAPIPDRLGNHYDQGLFQISTIQTLAITRGAGESGVRARLFAWPEVMVLTTDGK